DAFIFGLSASADRRGVDDDVELPKSSQREVRTADAEGIRQKLSLRLVASENGHVCAILLQRPNARARCAACADDRTTQVPQCAERMPQRFDETGCVGVVAAQLI